MGCTIGLHFGGFRTVGAMLRCTHSARSVPNSSFEKWKKLKRPRRSVSEIVWRGYCCRWPPPPPKKKKHTHKHTHTNTQKTWKARENEKERGERERSIEKGKREQKQLTENPIVMTIFYNLHKPAIFTQLQHHLEPNVCICSSYMTLTAKMSVSFLRLM